MRYFLSLVSLVFAIARQLRRQDQQPLTNSYSRCKEYSKSCIRPDLRQKTTNIAKMAIRNRDGYEAMSLPGSLRIDFTPRKTQCILFTTLRFTYSRMAKSIRTGPTFIPLMVLGFDIIVCRKTLIEKRRIEVRSFNLSQDTWQAGRFMSRAQRRRSASRKFWMTKELYLCDDSPGRQDGVQTQETQFNKYQKLGGGWILRKSSSASMEKL